MGIQRIEQAVMWRRLDGPGHDACVHGATGSGWRLMGNAVFLSDGAPCSLGYLVDADRDWRVRSAHVFGTMGTHLVDVFVTASEGSWLVNGKPQSRAAGAIDFELGFTPATKLFALRRHAMAVGGRAWGESAELLLGRTPAIETMRPRYTRLSEFEYGFDPGEGQASAVLRVDRQQCIVRFPGRWEREEGRTAAVRRPPAAPAAHQHRSSGIDAEPVPS